MTAGYVLVALLGTAALVWIVTPLLKRDAAEAEREGDTRSRERELMSGHDMVLAALKDLEEDRATDKISDADYQELKARLTGQAVRLMKQLDQAREEREAGEAPGPRLVPPQDSPG